MNKQEALDHIASLVGAVISEFATSHREVDETWDKAEEALRVLGVDEEDLEGFGNDD